MEQTEDTNRKMEDNSFKESFNNVKKQIENQVVRFLQKIDRKFEGLTKALEETTSMYKNLEKGEAQGSSKTARTSVECAKDSNRELVSRHQVCDADLCESNSSDARPYGESDEDNLNEERVLFRSAKFS